MRAAMLFGMLFATLTLVSTVAAAPRHRPRARTTKPKPATKKVTPVAPPAPVEPAPAPVQAPVLVAHDTDKVIAPPPDPLRRFTVGINPLPIIAGRYGVNVEVLPFRHHAIVGTAFYQTFTPRMLEVLMPSVVDVSRGADARFGGELGYRVYSGDRGAHGFFAGVSGVAMPLALPRLTPDFRSEVVSFHAFGGALDVGVQVQTSWGFTVGGGIGAMYLAYDPPRSATPPPGAPNVNVTAPHVLPRLLLSAGWSF
ncbi:MAG: hypothetical protein KIT84_28320 [Labilithrix sp.]|nr:hypothetical protein [Labilithrix sp.]MCW5814965.1 hypothetical protein [Labilithrix sp.]